MDTPAEQRGFPGADDYAGQTARHPALQPVDVGALQAALHTGYSNQVLLDVDDHCLRLAVFEGQYRWHRHPDSDELFLVVDGALEIEFRQRPAVRLGPWQCMVVPAGMSHRTRALGRTVNLTFERQAARTEFEE